MARSNNNLKAVLTDTADAIRAKKGTSEPIIPRDFADEIENLPSGGGDEDLINLLTDNLSSYTVPSAVYMTEGHELRKGAFTYAEDLQTLDFGGEDNVPESCCYGCSGLKSIYGDSVKIINASAFYNCFRLETISFPNCEMAIGNNLFNIVRWNSKYWCHSLNMSNLEIIEGYSTFAGLHVDGEVSFPKLAMCIGSTGFGMWISNNQRLVFPEFVAIEGGGLRDYAFAVNTAALDCPNWCECSASINIDGLFGNGSNCSIISIPLLQVSQGTFPSRAFYYARTGIKEVYNDYGFNATTSSAFYGCSLLEKFVGLVGAGGSQCFQNCYNLKSISIMGGMSNSAFTNCSKLESIYIIANGGTMSANALNGTPMSNSALLGHFGSIYVPSSMVDTFKASTNWVNYSDRITALPSEIEEKYILESPDSSATQIPASLASREFMTKNAFMSSCSISQINMPNLKYLGSYAFNSCTGIQSISLPECVVIGFGAFNRAKLDSNIASAFTLEFPKVKAIRMFAFSYFGGDPANTSLPSHQRGIVNLELPECLQVGPATFQNCGLIGKINAPEMRVFKGFNGASFLREVNVPKAKYFQAGTWPSCTSINAPEAVLVDIYSCGLLSEASFPKALELRIATTAITSFSNSNVRKLTGFSNNQQLLTVSFPNVEVFGESTFYNCKKLRSIRIRKVASLPQGCFMSCLSLSKALLENVDRIGLSCFGSCQKLESLYFPHHHIVNFETDQVIADASSMFYGTPMVNSALTGNYGSIYVPAVLLSAYQNDLDWSPLSDRLVGLTDEQFQNIIDHWDD